MFPVIFLLPALFSETLQSPLQNEVHEWGVVVFEENAGPMCGEKWNNPEYIPDYDYGDVCAEAPVVWIHGDPFGSAAFSVNTGEQSITFTYPVPDRTAQGVAEWDITSSIEEVEQHEERSQAYDGPFWWAVDSWRAVSSLPLYGVSSENFLYYECTVDESFTDNFFSWNRDSNPVFHSSSTRGAILFASGKAYSVNAEELAPSLLNIPQISEIDQETVQNIFSDWGNSNLNHSEISALWETWEPVFTEEDSYWLVFPIPADLNNSISTIRLNTGDERSIGYNRLFLGAVRVNLQ